MSIAVRMVDVNVSFKKHEILKHITVDFPGKGLSLIIGKSGSGKTTLLRSINRLNEEFMDCTTTGSIEVNFGYGLNSIFPYLLGNITLSMLRQKVGMVFQTPNVFPTSIYRNISLPLGYLKKYSRKRMYGRVQEVLDQVGLLKEVKNRLDMPAQHLSGGQQQRLCLARMLALEPVLLLLDEPTSSLDIQATEKIELLLIELAKSYPILMVSHNITQACRLAQYLVILENGTLTRTITHQLYLEEIITSFGKNEN